MSAKLLAGAVILLALAGCAGAGSDDRRFSGAYGGISGGQATAR